MLSLYVCETNFNKVKTVPTTEERFMKMMDAALASKEEIGCLKRMIESSDGFTMEDVNNYMYGEPMREGVDKTKLICSIIEPALQMAHPSWDEDMIVEAIMHRFNAYSNGLKDINDEIRKMRRYW